MFGRTLSTPDVLPDPNQRRGSSPIPLLSGSSSLTVRVISLLFLYLGDPLLTAIVFVADSIFNDWPSALLQERLEFSSDLFIVDFHCLLGLSALWCRRSSLGVADDDALLVFLVCVTLLFVGPFLLHWGQKRR